MDPHPRPAYRPAAPAPCSPHIPHCLARLPYPPDPCTTQGLSVIFWEFESQLYGVVKWRMLNFVNVMEFNTKWPHIKTTISHNDEPYGSGSFLRPRKIFLIDQALQRIEICVLYPQGDTETSLFEYAPSFQLISLNPWSCQWCSCIPPPLKAAVIMSHAELQDI